MTLKRVLPGDSCCNGLITTTAKGSFLTKLCYLCAFWGPSYCEEARRKSPSGFGLPESAGGVTLFWRRRASSSCQPAAASHAVSIPRVCWPVPAGAGRARTRRGWCCRRRGPVSALCSTLGACASVYWSTVTLVSLPPLLRLPRPCWAPHAAAAPSADAREPLARQTGGRFFSFGVFCASCFLILPLLPKKQKGNEPFIPQNKDTEVLPFRPCDLLLFFLSHFWGPGRAFSPKWILKCAVLVDSSGFCVTEP